MFNYKRVARLEAEITRLRELLWDAFYKSDLCQEPCYEREMYFCDYDTIEMKLKKSIEKKKKIEADLEQKEKFERLVREALKKN